MLSCGTHAICMIYISSVSWVRSALLLIPAQAPTTAAQALLGDLDHDFSEA